jgi:hypothetical protein
MIKPLLKLILSILLGSKKDYNIDLARFIPEKVTGLN